MSEQEAKDYTDLVIDTLAEMHIITEKAHGQMTVDQRDAIAEKLKELSES